MASKHDYEEAMDLREELQIATKGALFFRETDRTVLRVTGEDRASWLNGIVTCDVAKLAPGAFLYGLAVTQKGRIMADFNVVSEDAAILVTLPASEANAVRGAWEKYLVMEDCELALDDDEIVWRIFGSESAEIAASARAVGATIGAKNDGAIVIGKKDDAAKIETALASAGGILASPDTVDVLSQVAGTPRFKIDFDDKLYPQEAALEKRAVSFDKGCYLGQEVVCMLEMRGHVKRKLVSLAVDGEAPLAKGAEVSTSDGEKIGEVTSSAKTPDHGVLAIAMVKASHMTPGTELWVADAKAIVRDTI